MLKEYRSMIDQALNSINEKDVESVNDVLVSAMERKEPVLIIGNGGSAAIGDHFSADYTKCINEDTLQLANMRNLGSNMAIITAIANDISYEEIFSRQIKWCQNENAVVLAVSSSGSSPNIVNGLKAAREKGYTTIAFVGFNGGTVVREQLADHIIHVKFNNYGVVEDCHHMLMHTLTQNIRKTFTNKNTGDLRL